jgi:tRNA-specific 2-thiouridylase
MTSADDALARVAAAMGGLETGARVVVAMSGGVDSSATAAALVALGYQVVGITLKLYDAPASRLGACCAGVDIHDARRVAAGLDMPHYVLDYEQRFQSAVIDDFADSYLAGETPNPCVRCNQTVKFEDLLGRTRELGAQALVTGHYAHWQLGPDGAELHRGADSGRDQSYFLFATRADQLAFLRFPLGSLNKDATRSLAARFDLAVAQKPDSQDICFVPDGSYAAFIDKLRPDARQPGDIVDQNGKVLGRHPGIAGFTVGQRRGLGLGDTSDGGAALFVLRLEPDNNQLVVGPLEALGQERFAIRDCNWLAPPEGPLEVKVRSTSLPLPARIERRNGSAEVVLNHPEPGIAPGQACVAYQGGRLLGGGWIER